MERLLLANTIRLEKMIIELKQLIRRLAIENQTLQGLIAEEKQLCTQREEMITNRFVRMAPIKEPLEATRLRMTTNDEERG